MKLLAGHNSINSLHLATAALSPDPGADSSLGQPCLQPASSVLYRSPRQERRQGLALGGGCLRQPAQPALCRPCSGFWALSKHGAALRERRGGCFGSLQAASPFQQPPQRFLRHPRPSQTLLRPEGGRRIGAQPFPYPSLQAQHLCGQGWLLLLAQPLSLAVKTLPCLWTCSFPSSPHLCSGYRIFQGSSLHWRLRPVALSPCQPPPSAPSWPCPGVEVEAAVKWVWKLV